jgi:hypothetical protein
MTSRLQSIARFEAANLECARIIAADPVRYPGGAQEWARRVLARLGRRREPKGFTSGVRRAG